MNIADLHITTHSFKEKLFTWSALQDNELVCYLDSNDYKEDSYAKYECILAIGVQDVLRIDNANDGAFDAMQSFTLHNSGKWIFGALGYDLKNSVEKLSSGNEDIIGFPDLYLVVPRTIVAVKKNGDIIIESKRDKKTLIDEICSCDREGEDKVSTPLNLKPHISKEDYLGKINTIKQHIIDGTIYEMNFCQAFSTQATIDAASLFSALNRVSEAPFSAYLKIEDKVLLCGSPERFICKRGPKLISQPIKGTIQRGKDTTTDFEYSQILRYSEKDQAENVMIVDLVRNDLAKSCKTGSIHVEELFGIYPFKTVFQMISTISGELKEDCHWVQAIKYAFPMGSMTGAPKVMAMELIEELENTKRGIYSGAVGYCDPEEDFDFNVVIRSVLYDGAAQNIAFQVGGAIVYDSDAESEYEECLLKAQTMLKVLQ